MRGFTGKSASPQNGLSQAMRSSENTMFSLDDQKKKEFVKRINIKAFDQLLASLI